MRAELSVVVADSWSLRVSEEEPWVGSCIGEDHQTRMSNIVPAGIAQVVDGSLKNGLRSHDVRPRDRWRLCPPFNFRTNNRKFFLLS